jgi:hypothetical protein
MQMPNPDFEALKASSRFSWMLNFEAVATVANDEDSLDFADLARRSAMPS